MKTFKKQQIIYISIITAFVAIISGCQLLNKQIITSNPSFSNRMASSAESLITTISEEKKESISASTQEKATSTPGLISPKKGMQKIIQNNELNDCLKKNDVNNKDFYENDQLILVNMLSDNEILNIKDWNKFSFSGFPFIIYYPSKYDRDSNVSVYNNQSGDKNNGVSWGANIYQDNIISITVYPLTSDKLKKEMPGEYKYKLKNGMILQSSSSGGCQSFLETKNYYFLFQSGICGSRTDPYANEFRNILYNLEIKDFVL